MQIKIALEKLVSDESGAGLVEYGLLLALIAIAVITVLTKFEKDLTKLFKDIGKDLKN